MTFLRLIILLMAALAFPVPVLAGELTQEDIARRFPPPQRVGERLKDVPVWPITSELTPDGSPLAYVFESMDLAPIPGFEGTPINLLVTVDPKGNFMDVELVSQHEPVFLGGLGEDPLRAFLTQYRGHGLRQEFVISSPYGSHQRNTPQRAVLDGVTKATASIRIANQSVLAAALVVARARLGFTAVSDHPPAARVKEEFLGPRTFAELLARGDIRHRRWRNREVEALFAGTDAAGIDEESNRAPEETFVDLYVACVSAPTIGRNLLGESAYARLMSHLEPGQQAWWVATTGRHALIDDTFIRGSTPARLSAVQDGAPLGLRDGDIELPTPAGAPVFNAALVLVAPPLSGVDPSRAISFVLDVPRQRNQILPDITHRSLTLDYVAPEEHFDRPSRPLPDWLLAWQGRWPDLALICLALGLLTLVLSRPRWISISAKRLQRFRIGFLTFTLAFIGWHAQGQLSVVQITGAIKSLVAGKGLGSFLYDPVSLLLIAFTLITLFVWGRGSFCGWLCPFGALQEFVALAAARLGFKRHRLPATAEKWLARGRFWLLGVLTFLAATAPALAERLVEVEPFKTAITVGFDRAWPFVVYALAITLVGAAYYKFFCRFVCPLGAALVLGGRLRRLDWLRRRKECGQPCQTCRSSCEYDAIDRNGAIIYDKCFQCLDCVGILHDAQRCAPVILMERKGRRMEVRTTRGTS